MKITQFFCTPATPRPDQALVIEVRCQSEALIYFAVDLALELFDADGQRIWIRSAHQDQADAAWLPRGQFRWRFTAPEGGFPPASARLQATVLYRDGPHARRSNSESLALDDLAVGNALSFGRFTLDGDPDPATLSWRRGHQDWFFRHFDHAAPTVGSYLLKDSPLLRGRILDVGCGDGITDLGMFLRYQPERLVGLDPFRGYERLAEVAAAQGLPLDPWPAGLEFIDA